MIAPLIIEPALAEAAQSAAAWPFEEARKLVSRLERTGKNEALFETGYGPSGVPDPFGTHGSFGAHNNARLRAFLDAFGFDYEFLSATECYRSGRFDATLLTVLDRYDAVMAIMLPSLREERQQTYSPFLP